MGVGVLSGKQKSSKKEVRHGVAAARRSSGNPMAQASEGCDVAGLLPLKLGRCWCLLARGVQPKRDPRYSQAKHPGTCHASQTL